MPRTLCALVMLAVACLVASSPPPRPASPFAARRGASG